jgi:hypothetical protein
MLAISLCPNEAKAILTYNIYESGGDVLVETNGSLSVPATPDSIQSQFGGNGQINSGFAIIVTGPDQNANGYAITGPTSFDGSVATSGGSTTSTTTTSLLGNGPPPIVAWRISGSYVSGTPIISSSVFSGTTLAALGFTPGLTGLIGTWTLTSTGDTIRVVLGAPEAAPAPAPLPLLGAGAAFGWSRRLRRRIGPSAFAAAQD